MARKRIKCVVTGPAGSGKSSMLLNLTTGETANDGKDYIPTVFDNYATIIKHQGQSYELRFSDAGAIKELRASECRGADVVLVCFPVDELKHDVQVLANELRVFKEGAQIDSIVLVGTKSDLLDDDTITMKGWNLARELGARTYLQCSSTADNCDSVRELFKKVIDISTKKNAFLSDSQRTRQNSGDVNRILRTEDYQGLKKVLADPKEKERLKTAVSSGATSKLFGLKNDTFVASIIDQVDPETWKIKSKIEGRGDNLLHHFVNEGHRLSAIVLLTRDHPHVTDLVFEKNAAGNTPLMSSLKQRMEPVSHKIWEVILLRGQAKIEEISSQLNQILQLCAQNEENKLLLKILQGIHAQNPQKVCELVFAKTTEGRTILDTCKDKDTLIQILKLLEIKTVEEELLHCNNEEKNVLHHCARYDFHEAIFHLQIHLSANTFQKMVMQRSSEGNNAMMVSASHGNKRTLDILLRHAWTKVSTSTLYQNPFIGEILHHENKFGETLPTLAFLQSENLQNANHSLLEMEKQYHGADRDSGILELKACFRKHLRPSRDVQKVLTDIENSLPISSTIKTVAIWIKLFLTSLLIPVALFFFDMFFDAVLVYKYHDDDDNQYRLCREYASGRLSNETVLPSNDATATLCEQSLILEMPFVCTPLALDNYSRFNYSLTFIISPWLFFFVEFCQSEYWQASRKVIRRKRASYGARSGKFVWQVCSSLAKGTSLILIWPIWTRFLKFLHEGKYQTSHGIEKDKRRKKLDEINIFSSRSRMIEICSESSFQPLLQLYLLLPNLMCFNYSNLLEEDVSSFLSNIPKLQFWAIFTSCLSLSWSVNVYQALKKRGALDFRVNLFGRILLLVYCICQVTSRLFAFVLFAYSFGDGNFYPLIVLVTCHILIMAIIHWITTDNFDMKKTDHLFLTDKTLLYGLQAFYQSLLNGISNIYIYNNILLHSRRENQTLVKIHTIDNSQHNILRDQHIVVLFLKKWKQLVVDLIFSFEHLIIITCSSVLIDGLPTGLLASVAGLYFLGLAFKVIYYKNFHIWSGF